MKLGPSVSRTSCTEKFRGSQGFRGLILQVRKWFAHLLSICHQFTVIVPPVYISLPHEGPLLIAPKWQLANHHHHHHHQQNHEQTTNKTTNKTSVGHFEGRVLHTALRSDCSQPSQQIYIIADMCIISTFFRMCPCIALRLPGPTMPHRSERLGVGR